MIVSCTYNYEEQGIDFLIRRSKLAWSFDLAFVAPCSLDPLTSDSKRTYIQAYTDGQSSSPFIPRAKINASIRVNTAIFRVRTRVLNTLMHVIMLSTHSFSTAADVTQRTYICAHIRTHAR